LDCGAKISSLAFIHAIMNKSGTVFFSGLFLEIIHRIYDRLLTFHQQPYPKHTAYLQKRMMMKYTLLSYFFIACTAALLFTGCKGCFGNRFETLPEPVKVITGVDIPVSTINIPIHYEIKNFEDWINKKITGRFLETSFNPSSNKKDEVLLVLNKAEPIKISTSGDNLICDLPLHVTATIIKSRFGKGITKKFEPMQAIVHIQLITPVGLDAGWNIVTKFKIKSVRWLKEPVLQLGPLKQNLKRKVNSWLNENESQLTKTLDSEMNESVSLAPALSKIWYDLQRPLVIHKNEPKAWIKFACNSIEGKIAVLPGTIACYTSVQAHLSMMTDTSEIAAPAPLPLFKTLVKEKVTSDIHLYAFASFKEINEEVNSLLKGKEFTAKGYTVKIKKIKAYASEAGLSVEVTTGGDIKGKMVASGKPEFDVPTQTMHIRNFQYAMSSNSTMLNATEEILHRTITDTIASKLTLKLDTLIHMVPALVEAAIAKGKAGKVIEINFDHLYVQQCEIIMDANQVHFIIHAGAEADVELKELKTGKKLKIKTGSLKKGRHLTGKSE
jgi:hypothetical protein